MSSGATENLRLAAGVGPNEAPIGPPDAHFVADLAPMPYPELDAAPMYRRGLERGDYRRMPDLLHPPGRTPTRRPKPDAAELANDDRLLARLALRGHAGVEFRFFHEHQVRLGFALCRPLIEGGRLAMLCRAHGRPVGDLPDDVDPADVTVLARETALDGAAISRRVILVENRWHVDLGVRLLDLYTAACLHAYPAQYRAWFRHRIPRPAPAGLTEAGLPELARPAPLEPQELDERDYVTISFTAAGYPAAAISAVLGSAAGSIAQLRAADSTGNLVTERDFIGGIND